MVDHVELRDALSRMRRWAVGSQHRMRLERAFLDFDKIRSAQSLDHLHRLSRLGIWATELADAARAGEISFDEIFEELDQLGEIGKVAFERWAADEGGN